MGEAKRRGTFEQRKAQAIARHAEEDRLRMEQEAAREATMTPEEREARNRSRTKFAQLVTIAAGLDVGVRSVGK